MKWLLANADIHRRSKPSLRCDNFCLFERCQGRPAAVELTYSSSLDYGINSIIKCTMISEFQLEQLNSCFSKGLFNWFSRCRWLCWRLVFSTDLSSAITGPPFSFVSVESLRDLVTSGRGIGASGGGLASDSSPLLALTRHFRLWAWLVAIL